ncbi:MAG: hypothetical protein ACO1RT_18820 [Planctomycetaceae bacterium]
MHKEYAKLGKLHVRNQMLEKQLSYWRSLQAEHTPPLTTIGERMLVTSIRSTALEIARSAAIAQDLEERQQARADHDTTH